LARHADAAQVLHIAHKDAASNLGHFTVGVDLF
jgi:hypothetical protein